MYCENDINRMATKAYLISGVHVTQALGERTQTSNAASIFTEGR